MSFYNAYKGDVTKLLESIPCSETSDIKRLIKSLSRLIKAGKIKKYAAFALTKNKVKKLRDESKQAEKLDKERNSFAAL
jgi:hypothetical protein